MNKKILAISTFTLLLAGQTAIADTNDDGQEFLKWLDGADQVGSVEAQYQPQQFQNVSIRNEAEVDSNYKPEEDIFSIHFMSDK